MIERAFMTVVESGTAVLHAFEVRQADGRWLIVKYRHPQAAKRDGNGHFRRPRFNDADYPVLSERRPPGRWQAMPPPAVEEAERFGTIANALQRARARMREGGQDDEETRT